jgi:hypothetical protein
MQLGTLIAIQNLFFMYHTHVFVQFQNIINQLIHYIIYIADWRKKLKVQQSMKIIIDVAYACVAACKHNVTVA